MNHFVNGGGGAYISLGAALDWPAKDPVDVCGFYPRADALKAKFDAQTPMLKRPFWWWIKRVNSWPAKTETMSAVFNNNRAPFFQSFMEVRVEGSHNPPRVRLLLYGDAGRLRWRDLELMGRVIPEGQTADDPVEFVVPLTPGGPARP
jgi:hypothetical protein